MAARGAPRAQGADRPGRGWRRRGRHSSQGPGCGAAASRTLLPRPPGESGEYENPTLGGTPAAEAEAEAGTGPPLRVEEKTLTVRARERRDPGRGRVPPSWGRGRSPIWPGIDLRRRRGRSSPRKRSGTAREPPPLQTHSEHFGTLEAERQGVSVRSRRPPSSPVLTEAEDTRGKEGQRPAASRERGELPPQLPRA